MIDKTSFENCKPYKIYRRTVCQKPPASESVLLDRKGTGKLQVGPPLGAARPVPQGGTGPTSHIRTSQENRIQKSEEKPQAPASVAPRPVGRPSLGILERTADLHDACALPAASCLYQTRSPSRHFWITSSSMGKGMRKRFPIRIAPTLPELIHR